MIKFVSEIMDKRFDFIDIARCIAILMIVDVHLTSGSVFKPLGGGTFHVLGFFTLSGVVYGLQKRDFSSVKIFAINKVLTILYPYFSFSILNIILVGTISSITGSFDRASSVLIKTISLQGVGTLWFFPVFFFGQMFFFYMRIAAKNEKRLLIVSLLTFIITVFLSSIMEKTGFVGSSAHGIANIKQILVNGPLILLSSSIIGGSFIGIGCSIAEKINNLSSHNKNNIIKLSIIAAITLMFNIFIVPSFNGDLHRMCIGNPSVFIMCSFIGNVFLFTLSMLLEYIPAFNKALAWYGKYSIIIMTTHKEFYLTHAIYITLIIVARLLNVVIGVTVIGLLSLVIVFMSETIIIQIINHTSLRYLYTPFWTRVNVKITKTN